MKSITLAGLLVLAAARPAPAGYIGGNGASSGKPDRPVEWVSIPGGRFFMGDDESGNFNTSPAHGVTVKDFELSRTLVTVEQYAECVSDGGCTEPGTGGSCNWGRADRQRHPINCVDWDQAHHYAVFKGARLPSEAEYEYAATRAGKDWESRYPWGNEPATCQRAVMSDENGDGCGCGGTMPVCSKPAGNTPQGLCDMTGNVAVWVQDRFASYLNTPTDGSAHEASGADRVIRGGSFGHSWQLDGTHRSRGGHRSRYDGAGLRLAKSK